MASMPQAGLSPLQPLLPVPTSCLCAKCAVHCCRNPTKEYMYKHAIPGCIADSDIFKYECLKQERLDTVIASGVYEVQGTPPVTNMNKKYRYTAYKQFAAQISGDNGNGYMVPLPTCAYQAINVKYPR